MKNNTVKLILQGVVLLVLQVVIFRNVVLFDVAFCFVYIAVILFLPVDTDRILAMVIGFTLGIIVDAFYNSLGIHAFTAVFLAFIRYFWLNTTMPQGGYEGDVTLSISKMGIQWFTTFAIPLIFVHHFVLFYVEAGGFLLFGGTLLKVLLSSLFTFIVIVLMQRLFFSRKRGA